MADYFNVRVLNVNDRKHSSIVGSVAYTMRAKLHDEVLKALGHKKHSYDFSAKEDELYSTTLLVPPHAPEHWAANPLAVWTAAQWAEIAKSTKQFRKGAQLAKVATVHFNRVSGIPLWEQQACLQAFCKQVFVDHGLIVQIDVHPYGSALRPDTDDADHAKVVDELRDYPNTKIIDVKRIPDEPPCDTEHILRLPDGRHFIYMPHAHLTISTRTVTGEGFSKHKARHLNPSFANGRITDGDDWTDKWINHQNEWYGARGEDTRAVKTKLFDRRHTGTAYRTDAGRDEAELIRQETLKRLCEYPEELLNLAVEHQATFSVKDLQFILRRAGMTPKDARRHVAQALKLPGVVPLFDVMTSKRREIYTRTDVREQERTTLRLCDAIAAKRYDVKKTAIKKAIASRKMNAEQIAAFERHVGGEGITFTQGRAGAGKSYMIDAVREVHEASGFRVVGLAPTNSVASDMKKDGFAEASTVHAAVFKAEKGKSTWDENTLVVVDEAGMLDTEYLLKLLRHVASSGAKLVMVGDDRQLASVGRGGMWPLLTDRYGASLMNQINRQEADWQKAASVAFSEGRSGDALRAYEDRGHVHWQDDVPAAARAMLKTYAKDVEDAPEAVRFIYASTNTVVNELNAQVHDLHVACGRVSNVQDYETKRGPIRMGVGDRIQFYDNKKRDGIINGLMGRVVSASDQKIRVETDAGEQVEINPLEYQGFGHGYCGSIYRGQGKTVEKSYCLYDNKFAWSAKSAYVAMTRHKKQVDLFVPRDLAPDFDQLVRQVSREGRDGASLNWPVKSELRAFDRVVRAKAPEKLDPFKASWSKLWADFVVRATDTIAEMADPVRKAVGTIIDKVQVNRRPSEVVYETAFDKDAYCKKIRGLAAYPLRDEHSDLKSQLEVTEDPKRIQQVKAMIAAVEDEAARHSLDLENDPRIAQKKRTEDQGRREQLKQARRQRNNEKLR